MPDVPLDAQNERGAPTAPEDVLTDADFNGEAAEGEEAADAYEERMKRFLKRQNNEPDDHSAEIESPESRH